MNKSMIILMFTFLGLTQIPAAKSFGYISQIYASAVSNIDTDKDGLSDYEERCKYYTDPNKYDSDGDGVFDGDWDERREYTYSIKAICRIRKPANIQDMDDFFQDVKIVEDGEEYSQIEVLGFPFAKHEISPSDYPIKNNKLSEKYTTPTFEMNYTPQMVNRVREIVMDARTDVEAITNILDWISSETLLVSELPHWEYFDIRNKEIHWKPNVNVDKQKFLSTNFFADSMFNNKVHGTCSSLAIFRGAMLRAAGIPTRVIQTYPLIGRYTKDEPPLSEALRARHFAGGYDWGPGRGGANHMYNEVFIDNKWIRVDSNMEMGMVVGKNVFVKAFDFTTFDNFEIDKKVEDGWTQKRCFRTLHVSDRYPKYNKLVSDILIEPKLILKAKDGKVKVFLEARNTGMMPSGKYTTSFFAIDKKKKEKRLLAINGLGPINPGSPWKEATGFIPVMTGETQIIAITKPLDINNTVNGKKEFVIIGEIPSSIPCQ